MQNIPHSMGHDFHAVALRQNADLHAGSDAADVIDDKTQGIGCATADQLAEVVVTATRTPVPPSALGSSVDHISGEELARQQMSSLQAALGGVPGMPLFASGATGASASLFMRGANSNQILFLVDGLRLNDPNTDYGVFLGDAAVSPTAEHAVRRGGDRGGGLLANGEG